MDSTHVSKDVTSNFRCGIMAFASPFARFLFYGIVVCDEVVTLINSL